MITKQEMIDKLMDFYNDAYLDAQDEYDAKEVLLSFIGDFLDNMDHEELGYEYSDRFTTLN